ncbi:MAG: glycoside hydrolase family 2 TIM barrel-domain containing protein [Terracidiphilus sp.]
MFLRQFLAFASLVLFSFPAVAMCAPLRVRTVVDFNTEWKFQQADVTHAEEIELDDSAWHEVTVPHDWSIAGPVDEKNPSGVAGGFFPTGIVWYRKSFSLSAADANRHVYIAFDGVMANSDVWINGFHLGHRPNGFVSFYYELTGHLRFGENAHNLIAVRCDTSKQPASRWYEGGGIYRPVRLVVLQDVHLEPWSTYVTASAITAEHATVVTQTTVVNDSRSQQTAAIEITLVAPNGRIAGSVVTPAQIVAPGKRVKFCREVNVFAPVLWDINRPALYRAEVRVTVLPAKTEHAVVTDDESTPFGIREFHFSADTGFWLNGRNFKIKGVAIHADGGAFGIAVPLAVWERRLSELRSLGVNAIRTAHNPPSPEFLDLCDRMGFLVMDELFDCWTVGKTPYDYHLDFDEWSTLDARDTVLRDRNHPSIILWSAGNEIRDTPNAELAHNILARLIEVFHTNDPSRPVTQALFRPNASHDYSNGLADMLDVVGQNYRENEILAAHSQKPTRKILGTENSHDREVWLALRDNPPYAGQFLWAGFDYLGEAGAWPAIERPFGLIDRTGAPHPRGLQRESWWAETPNVHIFRRVGASERSAIDPGYEAVPPSLREPLVSDWTPSNSAPHTEVVEVYTNCDEVELLLNNRSLGHQKRPSDASALHWEVDYVSGTLQAVGYKQAEPIAEDELRTAGKVARILLLPERTTITTGDDAVSVEAVAVDASGVRVPDADGEVEFSVTGPGQILATDNGSSTDHESFLMPRHRLYAGRAVVWLRATAVGTITLHASIPGLSAGSAVLAAVDAPAQKQVRSF